MHRISAESIPEAALGHDECSAVLFSSHHFAPAGLFHRLFYESLCFQCRGIKAQFREGLLLTQPSEGNRYGRFRRELPCFGKSVDRREDYIERQDRYQRIEIPGVI